MKRFIPFATVILFLISTVSTPAFADKRNFSWSYEYKTMSKGEVELENYFTPKINSVDGDLETAWEHWLELEYGLTDKTDVGFYQMFKQKADSDLHYDGYKVRLRHKIGTLGQYPLDPLIYLEFIQKTDEIEFEQKVVLAKSLSKTFFSLNLTFEQEIESEEKNGTEETEVALKLNPSFGVGYQVSPRLSLSLELLNKNNISEGDFDKSAIFFGPTISWGAEKGWWTFSILPLTNRTEKVKNSHDELLIRSLVGIFF